MEPIYFQDDFVITVKFGKTKIGHDVVIRDPRESGRIILKRVVKEKDGKLNLRGVNKNFSTDSREFGWIGEDKVLGRVILRYYPLFGRGKFWFW